MKFEGSIISFLNSSAHTVGGRLNTELAGLPSDTQFPVISKSPACDELAAFVACADLLTVLRGTRSVLVNKL